MSSDNVILAGAECDTIGENWSSIKTQLDLIFAKARVPKPARNWTKEIQKVHITAKTTEIIEQAYLKNQIEYLIQAVHNAGYRVTARKLEEFFPKKNRVTNNVVYYENDNNNNNDSAQAFENAIFGAVCQHIQNNVDTLDDLCTSSDTNIKYYLKELYSALNKSEEWMTLFNAVFPRHMRTAEIGQALAALEADYKQKKQGNPAQTIMSILLKRVEGFSSMSVWHFLKQLRGFENNDVTNASNDLEQYIESAKSKQTKRNKSELDNTMALRSFLLANNICTSDQVDGVIASVKSQGVENINLLREFTRQDLKDCGFTTVQAIRLEKAFDQNK